MIAPVLVVAAVVVVVSTAQPLAAEPVEPTEDERVRVVLDEGMTVDSVAALAEALPAGVRLDTVETTLIAGEFGFTLDVGEPVRPQLEEAEQRLVADYLRIIDDMEASGEDVGVPIGDLRADAASLERNGLTVTALILYAEAGAGDAAVAAVNSLGEVARFAVDDSATGIRRFLLIAAVPALALVAAAFGLAWLGVRLFRR